MRVKGDSNSRRSSRPFGLANQDNYPVTSLTLNKLDVFTVYIYHIKSRLCRREIELMAGGAGFEPVTRWLI